MKKLILIFSLLFIIGIIPINDLFATTNLGNELKGKILLQVESNGEAWYINPADEKRYYLGRPDDAFEIMRELGLGISESNFNSFNNYAPDNLSGKILLRVEKNGEAYYVNPDDLKMHYLGRPADAFDVMRNLGLGISNVNLNKIEKNTDTKNCKIEGEYVDTSIKDSFECCSELVKVPVNGPVDINCEPIIPDNSPGYEPGWNCLACGDNICNDKYENKCNCPEDCEDCIPTGESADEYSFGKYIGPKQCCNGLSSIPVKTFVNGKCLVEFDISTICSNCGNGVCEKWENTCNCSKDCEEN